MFQRAMDLLLEKVKLRFVVVYWDNIVLFLQTLDELVDYIRQVFMIL